MYNCLGNFLLFLAFLLLMLNCAEIIYLLNGWDAEPTCLVHHNREVIVRLSSFRNEGAAAACLGIAVWVNFMGAELLKFPGLYQICFKPQILI